MRQKNSKCVGIWLIVEREYFLVGVLFLVGQIIFRLEVFKKLKLGLLISSLSIGWILISVLAVVSLSEQIETYTFDTTSGVLVESSFETKTGHSVYLQPVDCTSILVVSYTYTISGNQYVNNAYSFINVELEDETLVDHWSECNVPTGRVADFLAENPENGTVTVYFDPDQPDRSVLSKGVIREGGWKAAILVMNCVAVILIGYNFTRRKGVSQTSDDGYVEDEESKSDGATMEDGESIARTDNSEWMEEILRG